MEAADLRDMSSVPRVARCSSDFLG